MGENLSIPSGMGTASCSTTVPSLYMYTGDKGLGRELEVYADEHAAIGCPDIQNAEQCSVDGQVLWCSKAGSNSAMLQNLTPLTGHAAELKAKAAAYLAAGDAAAAAQAYQDAVKALRVSGGEGGRMHTAILLSNRAAALLRCGQPRQAALDAEKAAGMAPGWAKPLYRQAQALAAVCQWKAAIAAARRGEKIVAGPHGRSSDFEGLLDRLALDAAAAGCDAGFDGRRLEVRPAGEDAWLGGPAPEDPALDGPSAATSSAAVIMGASSASDVTDGGVLSTAVQRVSFRSLKEAVTASRDGDIITLLPGTHNGMGEAVDVEKRLLIQGGSLDVESLLDHRANVPALRLRRCCVVRRLTVDMTGFREALSIDGGSAVRPLVQDCIFRCSGDDNINAAGCCNPVFKGCTFQAKKAGIRSFGAASPSLLSCTTHQCGTQGVAAMEQSHVTLHQCEVSHCEEEGVMVMDAAKVELQQCTISHNKGPGVDVSGKASLLTSSTHVTQNVSGIMLWDASCASLAGTRIQGGVWPAVLADGTASVTAHGCTIEGMLHMSAAAKAGLSAASAGNTLVAPSDTAACSLPLEGGPFVWEPNRFSRKQ